MRSLGLAEIASIVSAYFCWTMPRLTIIVGVSSPVGWEKSSGRISKRLICSTGA